MKSRTAELLDQLRVLAAEVGEVLYDRAGMANEVLEDLDWIAAEHNGDRNRAAEYVALECFPDFCATGWFERLLLLRKRFALEIWKEHRFNLQRLWIRYETETSDLVHLQVKRASPIPARVHEEVKEELQSARHQLDQRRETITTLERENQQLRETVREKGRKDVLPLHDEKRSREYRHAEKNGVANPILAAKNATMKDLAEMIVDMIAAHPEPEKVFDLVCRKVERRFPAAALA